MTLAIITIVSNTPGLTYAARNANQPGMISMILHKDGRGASVDLYPAGMTSELIEETFSTLLNKLNACKNG